VSHTPAFPQTGEVTHVTIRATQGAARPTISMPIVVAVTPLVPGTTVDLQDVKITGPSNTDNSAARSASATYEITSEKALSAILGIQASTDQSGIRQVGYEISFGVGPPSGNGQIQDPDPNDKEPPRVVRTSPGVDETAGITQPIFVEFNEPISTN